MPTTPQATYRLTGEAAVAGSVQIWVVRWAGEERCGHDRLRLRTGPFAFEWTAEALADATILALRVADEGQLRFGHLRLETSEPPASEVVQTGARGGYRAWSLFADPSGDLPMTERHHRHYRGREPEWYHSLARQFAGARRVLDLGAGPGLLAAALRQVGVTEVDVVERHPAFLATCRGTGATVYEHDLTWPMPFLPSGHYDGAVAHQVLDYLPPTAREGVLRELYRVLGPGARCKLAVRLSGPATGDPSRAEPIDPDGLQATVHAIGFTVVSARAGQDSLRLDLTRGEQPHAPVPARPVTLPDSSQIRPWGAARTLLPRDPNAWDDVSRRDFTPLTTPEKEAAGFEAVFTGYRRTSDGGTARAVCRAMSTDGDRWERDARPILEAGRAGTWDEGGVAAGSFVRLEDDGARLFYSGRASDGTWAGIGIAERAGDGGWTRIQNPILRAVEFDGVRHLALADVIRRADGSWLMHLEGMRAGRWAVFQAHSHDGVVWWPASTDPVLTGATVPWGAHEVANPKCLETEGGLLVLTFNAAGPEREFQIGLATSRTGRDWLIAGDGPVRCIRGGERRIESLFLTRSDWRDQRRRAFFFRAMTGRTHESSDVMVAEANNAAAWPAPPWRSDRLDLYHVEGGRLTAFPGAQEPRHALARDEPLTGDWQCSGAVATRPAGGSTISVAVVWDDGVARTLLDAGAAGVDAWCVRILRPRLRGPEAMVRGWRDGTLILDEQVPLADAPARTRVALSAPPVGEPLVVEHLDVFEPRLTSVPIADAHVYAGVARTGDPLLPDITAEGLVAALQAAAIARALAVPYAADAQRNGIGELMRATRLAPGVVHPLVRLRSDDGFAADWTLDQLELLWQRRLIYGLKVHMGTDAVPPDAILEWVSQRELITLWHASRPADLDRLESDVLPRLTSPVLLSHFGGYPLDRARYSRAIAMLADWPQLRLVTSMVWFAAYLREAATSYPDRVLLGSDYPAVDPGVAQQAIRALSLDPQGEGLVLGESLRFLLARTVRLREQALAAGDVRFPQPPHTRDDIAAQGFEVVAPHDLPPTEPVDAKTFWAGYGVRAFYQQTKRWDRLPALLARDVAAGSVLEFGCNAGRNLAALREYLPDARLVGLDINVDAVAAGREATGLDLRVGDETALAGFDDGTFDLVFCISVLDHVVDVDAILAELLRCARRVVYLLEVLLPVEGRVDRHFDHADGAVRESTGASYSWDLAHRLQRDPRVWRVDCVPTYLHPRSLGPYYAAWTVWLDQSSGAVDERQNPVDRRPVPPKVRHR